jgi:hypothetical protein
MLVCKLIFKHSDFTGIMRKKYQKYRMLLLVNPVKNIHFLFLYVN